MTHAAASNAANSVRSISEMCSSYITADETSQDSQSRCVKMCSFWHLKIYIFLGDFVRIKRMTWVRESEEVMRE